jgi:hypothetical protein
MLEQVYGRETFDAFLQRWFEQHAFQSVTTDRFLEFLRAELMSRTTLAEGPPDVDAWVYGAGIGPAAPVFVSNALTQTADAAARYAAGTVKPKDLGAGRWNPHQWRHFIRQLPPTIAPKQLASLDRTFALTRSGNAEILVEWLTVGIAARYAPALRRAESFLKSVGRRRFLIPLYRALLESGEVERARTIYAAAKPGYHAIARRTLESMLSAPDSRPALP